MPVLNRRQFFDGFLLPEDQLAALESWARQHGRNWKSALRLAWETGNYDGAVEDSALQRVRNTKGPTWLISFRLPVASCPKCGRQIPRAFSFPDRGEGAEDGRMFYYCSENCRATH